MFAVVEIAGGQYEVKPNMKMTVDRLNGESGDVVEFNNILLAGEGADAKIGTPYVEGSVKARIIDHIKGDKVIVFKKKRRKGYRKLNGHRQQYTRIEITEVKY